MANDGSIRRSDTSSESKFNKLASGAKVKREQSAQPTPNKAVDSVVTEVSKAKESVGKIATGGGNSEDVASEVRAASQASVDNVEEAADIAHRVAKNAGTDPQKFFDAHDKFNKERARELLK